MRTNPEAGSPPGAPPGPRPPSARVAQGAGLVSVLFVPWALPAGIVGVVLGLRVLRHRRATSQPTGPAREAILIGAVSTAAAIAWGIYLIATDSFY